MPDESTTYYVEVGVWVEAESEEAAKEEVRVALRGHVETASYDILGVSPDA